LKNEKKNCILLSILPLSVMPQHPTAVNLSVRARILLFSIASRTDWQKADVPGETVIDVIEKGLVVDHPFDRLSLTMHGRAVLKAMLPGL
jgi:hypothetical protein